MVSQARWLTTIIPATQEDCGSRQAREKVIETPFQPTSSVWLCMSVIPITKEGIGKRIKLQAGPGQNTGKKNISKNKNLGYGSSGRVSV
jgi:hypothetical protein